MANGKSEKASEFALNALACERQADRLESGVGIEATRDLLPWGLIIGRLRLDAALWRKRDAQPR